MRALPGRKTLNLLRWTTKLWTAWQEKKGVEIGEDGPSWEDLGKRTRETLAGT